MKARTNIFMFGVCVLIISLEIVVAMCVSAQSCDSPPSGLVSWWPGDGNANDIIGGNSGTLQGAVSFGSGEVEQAFSLDGLTAWIDVPNSTALSPTGPFTLECWVKANPNQTDPGRFLIVDHSHGAVDFSGWLLQGRIPEGVVDFGFGTGSSFPVATTTTSVLDNTWHHLAGVFTGTAVQIYCDGVLQGSSSLTTLPLNNNRDVEIGSWWGGGTRQRYFTGFIDEVSYYDRALPASEIAAIYNAGSAGKCKTDCQGVISNAVKLFLSNGRGFSQSGEPTSIEATFQPTGGLAQAKANCSFVAFDWQQTIEVLPDPSPFFQYNTLNSNAPIHLTDSSTPFRDPPPGGYTYPIVCANATVSQAYRTAYPFYYDPYSSDPNDCFSLTAHQYGDTYIDFYDAPADNKLPPGQFIVFRTELVGINTDGTVVPNLYTWTWIDSFNGSSGGISRTANDQPVDPGSGTGGITITSINGVPQTLPSVSCSATPNNLWPPNGKLVSVTISGSVIPGTQAVPSTGITYSVSDEYGSIQPSGQVIPGPTGSYSFTIQLQASRNGNDADGRQYTVMVSAQDNIGNVRSASAVVTVPHDQGH